MENFTKIFALEFKRFLNKNKVLIILFLLFFSIFVSNKALNENKKTLSNIQNFKELESEEFKNLQNYNHYSYYGVKSFFVPSPLGILLKTSGTNSEISARVDSIISLNIFINVKGRALFEADSTSPFRLYFIIMVLGTLSVLFLGYESMRDKEFIKTLASLLSYKKIFTYIVLSRIILLTFIMIGFFAFLLIFIKLNGINLSNELLNGLYGYFAATWIMIIGFFSIGVLIGNIKNNVTSLTVLLSIWFILVFFLPGCLESFISKKSNNITSSYKVEFEQLKIVNDFEKRSFKNYGKLNKENIETERKIVEEYFKRDYKKIEALEKKIENDISNIARSHRNLAILFPVTLFKLTGDSASSMDLENLLKFYSFLKELKRRFLRFWIDRVFYNDPKELVSFIKGDENLYYAKSQLPDNFGTGVGINLGYIIILIFFSYLRFNKALFPKQKYANEFSNINLNFVSGKHMAYKVYYKNFIDQLLNVFFGKIKKFSGKITLDKKNIVTKEKKDFLYLPQPGKIPGDIKTKTLLKLFKSLLKISKEDFKKLHDVVGPSKLKKYFYKLENHEKALLLLKVAQMTGKSTIILDNITAGIPDDFQKEIREAVRELVNNGYLIINIFYDQELWMKPDSFYSIHSKYNKNDELTVEVL